MAYWPSSWDDKSEYHSNAHHPCCSQCDKYLAIPLDGRLSSQTCEHYDAWVSGRSENADFSGYGLKRGIDIGGRRG